MKRSLMNDF
jgi:perosamine synthetase